VSFHVDLSFLENWKKRHFWSFQFYGPECQKFTQTKPLVLTGAILSKGLTQSKTLD